MKVTLKIDYAYQDYIVIEALLNEIINNFNLLIPDGPTLGVKELIVFQSINNPVTPVGMLPDTYLIGITPQNASFDQIAYQFAHELCHLFIDPRVTNWLVESFCECMSFVTLEKLSISWGIRSSLPGYESYATNFACYIDKIVALYFDQLSARGLDFSSAKMGDFLLETPYDRTINFIAAYKIFDIYRSDADVLSLVPYLRFTTIKEKIGVNEFVQSIEPDIHCLGTNLPLNLRRHWDVVKQIIY